MRCIECRQEHTTENPVLNVGNNIMFMFYGICVSCMEKLNPEVKITQILTRPVEDEYTIDTIDGLTQSIEDSLEKDKSPSDDLMAAVRNVTRRY